MISRIQGKIREKRENELLIDVNGLCYKVLVPTAIMKSLGNGADTQDVVDLITYHYHQIEPSKAIPILIGFTNEIEKEFFEKFITVSGVGPKAAVRALSVSIPVIARAIDEGNLRVLKSLPGIGEQRAREIIAKLQGRVGKYGLIQDKESDPVTKIESDVEEEALEVLLQLQYKNSEAKEMLDKAIQRNPSVKSSEELLNEVYKQKHGR